MLACASFVVIPSIEMARQHWRHRGLCCVQRHCHPLPYCSCSGLMFMFAPFAVIPSIEMAAAGLDSIGAIVGFAVCSGIAIPSGNLVYSICSGPLQVVYGLILACVGTLICSCTRFWNNRFKRAAAVFFTGVGSVSSIQEDRTHWSWARKTFVLHLSCLGRLAVPWDRKCISARNVHV